MSRSDDVWRFDSVAAAQRAEARDLDWWHRLLAHDELLETALMMGGDRLRRRLDAPPDRRHRITGGEPA